MSAYVNALNAAAADGRCWRVRDPTRAVVARWDVGDLSDIAARAARRGCVVEAVPRDRRFVHARPSGLVAEIVPREDLSAVGALWRAATGLTAEGPRLLVDHPTHGWTAFVDEAHFLHALSQLASLPPDDGRPRRFHVDYAFSTNPWDAAWHLSARASPALSITDDVSLVHATATWAYWSDGAITPSRGLAVERPQGLSADAVTLVTVARESKSARPTCGWEALASVARIVSREVIVDAPRRPLDHRVRVVRLRVVTVDGVERDLWARLAGTGEERDDWIPDDAYGEGYDFDVVTTPRDDWSADADGALLPLDCPSGV